MALISVSTTLVDTDREGQPCAPYVQYGVGVVDPDPDPGCPCCNHGPVDVGIGTSEEAAWDDLFMALRRRTAAVEAKGRAEGWQPKLEAVLGLRAA